MEKLVVIILTKNEELHIADAVQNARQCTDEVLVVDSGSTDDTVRLATRAGARVVFRAWDNDFSAQRNFALTQTEADWVLYLDADERMSHAFCEAVQQTISASTPVQGAMQRVVRAFGHEYHHGIFAPDWTLRLFPRAQIRWVGQVHERPECPLPQRHLAGHVYHYTYADWHQWVQKINQYTTLWAHDQYAAGKRTTAAAALMHAAYGGVRAWLLQGGFLDGWAGCQAAVQHTYYTWLKYTKLLELQRKKSS